MVTRVTGSQTEPTPTKVKGWVLHWQANGISHVPFRPERLLQLAGYIEQRLAAWRVSERAWD